MTTRKGLFLIYDIENTSNTYLRKVTKFQGDGVCRFGVLGIYVENTPSVYMVKEHWKIIENDPLLHTILA